MCIRECFDMVVLCLCGLLSNKKPSNNARKCQAHNCSSDNDVDNNRKKTDTRSMSKLKLNMNKLNASYKNDNNNDSLHFLLGDICCSSASRATLEHMTTVHSAHSKKNVYLSFVSFCCFGSLCCEIVLRSFGFL